MTVSSIRNLSSTNINKRNCKVVISSNTTMPVCIYDLTMVVTSWLHWWLSCSSLQPVPASDRTLCLFTTIKWKYQKFINTQHWRPLEGSTIAGWSKWPKQKWWILPMTVLLWYDNFDAILRLLNIICSLLMSLISYVLQIFIYQ